MPMGGLELLIILVIILLFFGAKRVPELGRSLGKSTREFRKEVKGDTDEAELHERREDGELPRRQEARHVEEHDQTERHDRRV